MTLRKLHDRKYRHDKFYKQAKQEGFAGRAVYKLDEIDKRLRLFQPGMKVLDLGCWPGSWLQYAAKQVGVRGTLVGIDRFAVEIEIPNFRMIVGDVFTTSADKLRGELPGFDVVLSDMAPDTSGIRMTDQAKSEALFARALEIAEQVLVPGGNFVGKLFQGPEWNLLLKRGRNLFEQVKLIKPESSRKESIEQYVVGLRRKGSLLR